MRETFSPQDTLDTANGFPGADSSHLALKKGRFDEHFFVVAQIEDGKRDTQISPELEAIAARSRQALITLVRDMRNSEEMERFIRVLGFDNNPLDIR